MLMGFWTGSGIRVVWGMIVNSLEFLEMFREGCVERSSPILSRHVGWFCLLSFVEFNFPKTNSKST